MTINDSKNYFLKKNIKNKGVSIFLDLIKRLLPWRINGDKKPPVVTIESLNNKVEAEKKKWAEVGRTISEEINKQNTKVATVLSKLKVGTDEPVLNKPQDRSASIPAKIQTSKPEGVKKEGIKGSGERLGEITAPPVDQLDVSPLSALSLDNLSSLIDSIGPVKPSAVTSKVAREGTAVDEKDKKFSSLHKVPEIPAGILTSRTATVEPLIKETREVSSKKNTGTHRSRIVTSRAQQESKSRSNQLR
jgi:hypothetical protein